MFKNYAELRGIAKSLQGSQLRASKSWKPNLQEFLSTEFSLMDIRISLILCTTRFKKYLLNQNVNQRSQYNIFLKDKVTERVSLQISLTKTEPELKTLE